MESIEMVADYKPGGLPPVHLGETYEDRYRIIHKLGHGGFATVWLARDLHQHRYVAIKMTKSNPSENSSEKEILRLLASRSSTHPGRHHVNQLLDLFTTRSLNGIHDCLVFDLRGPSILSLQNDTGYRVLRGKTTRALCQQLLCAIDYLHSQKVVHGDVTPGNLLLGLSEDIHQCSEEEVLDWIGHPVPKTGFLKMWYGEKEIPTNCPRYQVDQANVWGLGPMITAELYVSDFGEAFDAAEKSTRRGLGGIPLAYKAPEVLFEQTQGMTADTWAAACCMHFLRFGFGLLDSMGGAEFLVHSMIDHVGNIPQQWSTMYFDRLRTAKLRSEYTQNKASQENINIGPEKDLRLEPETLREWPKCSKERPLLVVLRRALEQIQSTSQVPESRQSKIEHFGKSTICVIITDDEAICMSDLLSRMLTWNPQDRAVPNQLLEHEWFDNSRFAADDIDATVSQPLLQVDLPKTRELAEDIDDIDDMDDIFENDNDNDNLNDID